MAAHFRPVINEKYRLVAPPPPMQTAIGGYSKVASYDLLAEQLQYSRLCRRVHLLGLTIMQIHHKLYHVSVLLNIQLTQC